MTQTRRIKMSLDQTKKLSVAFIGSECYPFVKTGGLGDVMYALPKDLVELGCDVRVLLPKYACIKDEFKDAMEWKGSFYMDLTLEGREFFVAIMELERDGVIYDFIENEQFFSYGNPYTNLIDDIERYCYFSKASLAALNSLEVAPDIIHCHDWQAAIIPIYLKTQFAGTPVGAAKSVLTIHNLRFQGIYGRDHIKYWTNLPDEAFSYENMAVEHDCANMFKGGIAYADLITTVSETYAGEIQTWEYGETLDGHLRYHGQKLKGIVNGIAVDMWDPSTDALLEATYTTDNVIEAKKANKRALQEQLGLEVDDSKFLVGLISRLTNQKGLDLVTSVVDGIIDDNTQLVVLGTGDAQYEDSFRYFEGKYPGKVCAYISYNEALAHKIYAGSDVLLVPSQFEPCGLTQLIAMHYGTIPVVRETGGLKDTVEPYNKFEDTGNGFTFDRYEAGLLYDAIERAKALYLGHSESWKAMVIRDMEKDVSWEASAKKYYDLYVELLEGPAEDAVVEEDVEITEVEGGAE